MSRPGEAKLFPPRAAGFLVALLAAVCVAGFAWSASFQDTARDVFAAYRIANGRDYPLEGPILGNALHLGPVWYYLMAIPLWVHSSWLAIALFAGALCALKFPLALWVGTRLVDRDFGVWWALALALPGWSTFEQLVFFNPIAAATAVLLVIAAFLRCVAPAAGPGAFAALGAAIAFALHVHPTTAPLALLVAVAVWRRRRDEPVRLAFKLLAFVAAALAFLAPYIASQAQAGFPDWNRAGTYVESRVAAANLANLPVLEASYVAGGPYVVARHLMGLGEWGAAALAAIATLLLLASLVAVQRRLLGAFAAGFLVLLAWIAWLRPETTFYFVFVLGPFAAGLVALGLWTVSRRLGVKAVAWAAAASIVVLQAAVVRNVARVVRDGEGRMPVSVADIKDSSTAYFRDTWFPASGRAALGRALCPEQGEIVLHGPLAYLVDRSLAADALLECGRRSQVKLGGAGGEARRHRVGMTRHFWGALDVQPACWLGSLGLDIPARVLWPEASKEVASGDIYPPRIAFAKPPVETRIAFELPRGDALLFTQMFPGYESHDLVSIQADGAPARTLATNDSARLFVPANAAPAGKPARWILVFRSTDPGSIDVVAIRRDSARGSAASCDVG